MGEIAERLIRLITEGLSPENADKELGLLAKKHHGDRSASVRVFGKPPGVNIQASFKTMKDAKAYVSAVKKLGKVLDLDLDEFEGDTDVSGRLVITQAKSISAADKLFTKLAGSQDTPHHRGSKVTYRFAGSARAKKMTKELTKAGVKFKLESPTVITVGG